MLVAQKRQEKRLKKLVVKHKPKRMREQQHKELRSKQEQRLKLVQELRQLNKLESRQSKHALPPNKPAQQHRLRQMLKRRQKQMQEL